MSCVLINLFASATKAERNRGPILLRALSFFRVPRVPSLSRARLTRTVSRTITRVICVSAHFGSYLD
jgi:hypothetical protein